MRDFYQQCLFACQAHQYGDGKTLYSVEEAIKKGWWGYVSMQYPTLDIIDQYRDQLYWIYIIDRVDITNDFFVKYNEYLLPWASQILNNVDDNVFLSDENLAILKKQSAINIASRPRRKLNPTITIH